MNWISQIFLSRKLAYITTCHTTLYPSTRSSLKLMIQYSCSQLHPPRYDLKRVNLMGYYITNNNLNLYRRKKIII